MIYRGYDIERAPNGNLEWKDDEGRIRNGFVNGVQTYKSEEDVMDDIDAYRKAKRIT